ncbi:xylulokinase [Ignavigranum ruoffiae]|uniref:Xylulose kinase n=1 Tax=Ignavigranum ruoffiae TaxID=89093 RepID=A0A1H9B7Q9_9LACT|nr:xylulokinase [Ignavigranum ruoffiae]SEP84288.1 xylulokinase [Ignavigranum ruoffiae]
MSYVLGIDIGTGSIKGLLLNSKDGSIDNYSSPYKTFHPKKGFSEQNPNDWINGLKNIFEYYSNKLNDFNSELEAISFSGQMHTLVLLDKFDNILRPAILWNDVRTTEETILLNSINNVKKITLNKAVEGFTLPKILWIQNNEPEIWEKVDKILLPKDFMIYYLTKKFVTEPSDAAGTLMMDIDSKQWSSELLNEFNIGKDKLPNIISSLSFAGFLNKEFKVLFHFSKNIKIYMGGADNACSALGIGIKNESQSMLSIGTSGVLLSVANIDNSNNEDVHIFNHVIPDTYYKMGVTLSAGASLNWFKNIAFHNEKYDEIFQKLEKYKYNNSIVFAPYLNGERMPHADSDVRGAFLELDINSTRYDLLIAVLEGIIFSIKDAFNINNIRKIENVISVGGGAKNEFWLQMQADIFEKPIIKLQNEEGAALGALIIAAIGAGIYDSFEESFEKLIKVEKIFYPNENRRKYYREKFIAYKKVYSKIRIK